MATRARKPPLSQAYALAKAMKHRPTPALASLYFDTLRRVIDGDPPPPAGTSSTTTTSPVPHV